MLADYIARRLPKIRVERPSLAESSLKTYVFGLRRANKLFVDRFGERADWLTNPSKMIELINSTDDLATKRNILNPVIIFTSKRHREPYSALLKTINAQYVETLKDQKKTPKQASNWLDYKTIIALTDKLKSLLPNNNKTQITRAEYADIQVYVMLMVYLKYPIRNELADMEIVPYAVYRGLTPNKKINRNFLVKKQRSKWFFSLNRFKTVKSLGPREIPLDQQTIKLLTWFLQYNTSGYLFLNKSLTGPISRTEVTNLFTRLFLKHTGKRISTSMLRHIIISHFAEGQPSIRQAESTAENTFLHSASMNSLYRKL
jgi:hypothetical protein